jgi:solute carrier family 25 (mitochondrial S-adenosylmethionine transporter), member 26
MKGLFTGWQLNLTKDVPFAVVKLTVYESCLSFYHWLVDRELNPSERTGCGIASGAVTALLTNPLDVINTRMKTSKNLENNTMGSFYRSACTMVREEGAMCLMRGFTTRLTIISLGSGTFWGVYSYSQEFFKHSVFGCYI